jgi:macrolide-specific efflux system membrane fusion protein
MDAGRGVAFRGPLKDDTTHDRRAQAPGRAVKKLLVFLLLAGALSAGVYWWRFAPRTYSVSEDQLAFAPMQRATMREIVSATGLVKPREVVLVGSEMPGMVTHVLGKVNQHVSEGTVLAQLDDRKVRLKVEEADNGVRTAKAALAQAQASRDAAQIALKVQIELSSKGGFRSDKEQADAQAKAAEAGVQAALANLAVASTAYKEAQLALERTLIKVPPGKREFLILERQVNEGQMVGPQGSPLFTLAGDLGRVEVHAQVAEGDISKVRKGQAAVFLITTFADEDVEFRGVVKEIRPLANNIKGAVFYDTVIDVENQKDPQSQEWRLRPGMTVSVDVIRREHKDVWRVPAAAVNFRLEEAYRNSAAKARLAQWQQRTDADQWHTLWIWDRAQEAPAPVFVRLGGLRGGEPGLKDSEGNEVLEWEPGREPSPGDPAPSIIIQAPPARPPGFFDRPANIKVS